MGTGRMDFWRKEKKVLRGKPIRKTVPGHPCVCVSLSKLFQLPEPQCPPGKVQREVAASLHLIADD